MIRARAGRVVLALLMLGLTACRVEVSVSLDVHENGSGTVAVEALFDEPSAATLGALDDQLRLGDLSQAGWDVTPEAFPDGSVRVQATKLVANRADWQTVLDEIAGPGVFADVRITAGDEFARQTQQLSFDIDVRDGWDLLSDAEVTEVLGGEPFGAPVDSLTDGRPIDDIIALEVSASVTAGDDSAPSVATFSPRFDDDEPVTVRLVSTSEQATAVLLRWIALALGSLFLLATVLAVTGIVLQRRADRLRPDPRPASLASRVPGARSEPAAAATAVSPGSPSGAEAVRLVVVEPLTVFYRRGNPIDAYLLPFVRKNDGPARADTIVEGYAGVLRGSLSTAAFWELCGVEGPVDVIDETFTTMRRLRPGTAGFLNEMQRRRIPVAAATNDAATWSELARQRDRLFGVWPWLISAEIGAVKPNPGIFEKLRRESGVAYTHCLYVDTDVANLDVARDLGMKTALFDSGDLELPEIVGHPVVTDLADLFGK